MKYYTSIEQSKKLLELGLSPESADMYYKAVYRLDKPKEILEYTLRPIIGSILKAIEHKNLMRSFTLETKTYKMKDIGIPCWSVGALLELIPKLHSLQHSENGYFCSLANYKYVTEAYNNSIDACYNMVIWFLENGYIKRSCT